MVSVKLKFRPSSVNGKKGRLYYQVICMSKVRQIATNFKITESEWNSDLECVVIGADDSRADYLHHVQNRIECDKRRFMRVINKFSVSNVPFTVDALVNEFNKQSSGITFFSYMEHLIAQFWTHGQFRTSETYRATLNSFKRFRNGADLYFDDIDSEMLISYENYLRTRGLAPNTISFYMKRLRAVYNNAVEDGCANERNLFKKVFTSSEKTVKRAISLRFLRKLKDMDLSCSKNRCFARDMFLFSFYTRGMSFVDMAYLQKKNLKYDVLTYRRKKTGQLLSVHWENCMQEIVERYSSCTSPYMLSIIKNPTDNIRKQYHNALTLVNHNLKAIGRELGLNRPLTMYVARHSWASIARDEGIPITIISEGMGHDSVSTTQIYLASLETQIIDKANKKILKLL